MKPRSGVKQDTCLHRRFNLALRCSLPNHVRLTTLPMYNPEGHCARPFELEEVDVTMTKGDIK